MTYWYPDWFDWVEDWSGSWPPEPGDDIPPGLLALACLVGGGTAVVGGTLQGNTAIVSDRQMAAAQRQHGAGRVAQQGPDLRSLNVTVRDAAEASLQNIAERQAERAKRRNIDR
jgi:hypothetical protein